MAKVIAGIDVGSSKTAAIIAQVNPEEEKINVVGTASVPSRGVRKGQIVNIDEATEGIIQAVEAAERMAGYNISHVLVSVGGAHIASQNSKGVVAVAEPEGEITPEDIKRVIEAARAVSLPSSREILHCLPRHFIVDSQEGIKDPVGMSGVRLEVETHIVTGSSTAMRNLAKCVSEIGADIDALVFGGIAAAEAVLTETEKELGVILVDIGGGTTEIVIFVDGASSYTSVLPIGAKNVTNDLAIGLRLSLESAEKLKLALSEKKKEVAKPEDQKEEEGTEKKDEEIDLVALGIHEETSTGSRKTLVEGIIKPRLNEIFTMVGLELKKSGFGGMTPSGVVLAGGGSETAGVVEAAKRTLSMPVRVGTPTGVNGIIDDVSSPAFAVLVGLILYGAKMEIVGTERIPFSQISKLVQKVPVRGMAQKTIEFIKSFLP